jgi:hypothetical protein
MQDKKKKKKYNMTQMKGGKFSEFSLIRFTAKEMNSINGVSVANGEVHSYTDSIAHK